MVFDEIGTGLLPEGWRMWTTDTKWQAMRINATEEDKRTYTPVCKTRGDAIRIARKLNKKPL